MIHGTLEEVGNGFLTAVRVVWETGAWGASEVVEHEEWREVPKLQKVTDVSNLVSVWPEVVKHDLRAHGSLTARCLKLTNSIERPTFGVPMERRTLAPTPSDCSTARKTWRMARAVDMLAGLVGSREKWRVRENGSEAWLRAACGIK